MDEPRRQSEPHAALVSARSQTAVHERGPAVTALGPGVTDGDLAA